MSGETGMSAREVILARITEALRVPAPLPHGLTAESQSQVRQPQPRAAVTTSGASTAGITVTHAAAGLPTLTVLPEEVARPWLPDGGETPAERLQLLIENLVKLRAIVQQVPDLTAASDYLFTIARERDWQRVAWHPHPLVEPLLGGVPCATYRVDAADFEKNSLESCDAGITSCEALVAQTGSILVSSATSGGRALSITCTSSWPRATRSWPRSPMPSMPRRKGMRATCRACSPSSPAPAAPATSSGSSYWGPTGRRN